MRIDLVGTQTNGCLIILQGFVIIPDCRINIPPVDIGSGVTGIEKNRLIKFHNGCSAFSFEIKGMTQIVVQNVNVFLNFHGVFQQRDTVLPESALTP
ncbi:MAG: hypothetical protein BWX55_00936 [Deltaproteobacteria bacterium ADurb.Bin022]|nr:MAG: hypothetical protein BWX55_00936 [Deltaproteobacteria bacterium ADurb.Bin022]